MIQLEGHYLKDALHRAGVFDALMDAALNKTFKQGELNPQALAGKNPRGNNSKGPDS